MSLALALKILLLAVLFVVSGGALFSDWGRRHMVLVGLASIVAILGTFYLFADLYEDLKRDSVETVRQELLAQQRRSDTRDQPETVQRQPEPQPAICDGVEVDLASGGTTCIVPGSGESFKECAECPEMVVVPAGRLMMGSTEEEIAALTEAHGDYFKDEGPQHEVAIPQPFAVGKFEVTWDEWEACVAAGDCDGEGVEQALGDNDWGKGNRPVIKVSWNDAQAYAKWLSEKTGKSYRLLSEAQWEYAARAGTTSRFWFGDDDSELGEHAWYRGNSGFKTHPVGEKPANPWDLHDVHGNVWEWVEDCWNASYADKPDSLKASGEAWTAGDCNRRRRVLRGGSWDVSPRFLRSAKRLPSFRVNRNFIFGFRLARTLTP